MLDKTFSPYLGRGITSKSQKPAWKAILLLIIFFLSLTFLGIRNFIKSSQSKVLSSSINPTKTNEKKETNSSHQEILNKLERIIAEGGGTYSVYIYDINNKQGFGINEQTIITAASVNKIPILAVLYHLAGKGEIDLEKTITLQQSNIQDYGTGSIRYDPLGTVYSIKTLARLMMEKSDNTAAYILGTLVLGLDKIQTIIASWGLTQTDMEENKSSANDMAILMIKMYHGEITTKALTSEMLGFMDKSDFDDRIPKGIPEGVTVYHKTGDEVGKIHDAGIVDLKKRPYYLGIFTIDMTDDEMTKKLEAKISKIVFDYMEKL